MRICRSLLTLVATALVAVCSGTAAASGAPSPPGNRDGSAHLASGRASRGYRDNRHRSHLKPSRDHYFYGEEYHGDPRYRHERREHDRRSFYGGSYPWGIYRPRRHDETYDGDLGLQYHNRWHRYSREREDRKIYPHTYDGQFGRPRAKRGLTHRFFEHPALSPFSRSESLPQAEERPTPAPVPKASPAPGPDSDLYESGASLQVPIAPPVRTPAPWQNQVRLRTSRAAFAANNPAHRQAWQLLAKGYPEQARSEFASAALASPEWGRPRVGYAICASLQGHESTAVWVMRRAVKLDGKALIGIALTATSREQITSLREKFANPGVLGIKTTDGLFMTAVIEYLLDNNDAARDALIATIQAGDRHMSTLRLRNLLMGVPERRPVMPRQDLSV